MNTGKEKCCSLKRWQEKIKNNNTGERWIKYLLFVQILYYIAYNVINGLNHQEPYLEYEIFVLVVLFWLTIAAIIFYSNIVYKYKIGELMPF